MAWIRYKLRRQRRFAILWCAIVNAQAGIILSNNARTTRGSCEPNASPRRASQSSQRIPNFKFACPQFFTSSRIFHNRKFFASSSLSSRSSRLNRGQNSYNSAWSEHEILDMNRLEFLRGKQCSFNRMRVSLSPRTVLACGLDFYCKCRDNIF